MKTNYLLTIVSLVVLSIATMDAAPKPKNQKTMQDLSSGGVEETHSNYFEATGRNLEVSASAINLPLVAEIQVLTKKIVYVETEAFKKKTVTEVIRQYGKDLKANGLAEYKRLALANAANANNADLIVGATFVIETTEDNHFSVKVTGYPAVYKNFHTATPKDAEILKIMEPYMQITNYDPVLNGSGAPIVTSTTSIIEEQ